MFTLTPLLPHRAERGRIEAQQAALLYVVVPNIRFRNRISRINGQANQSRLEAVSVPVAKAFLFRVEWDW